MLIDVKKFSFHFSLPDKPNRLMQPVRMSCILTGCVNLLGIKCCNLLGLNI
jgi:hypothetical protein